MGIHALKFEDGSSRLWRDDCYCHFWSDDGGQNWYRCIYGQSPYSEIGRHTNQQVEAIAEERRRMRETTR